MAKAPAAMIGGMAAMRNSRPALSGYAQIVRIRDLILRDQPRSHAGERVGALVAARIADPGIDVLDLLRIPGLGMDGTIVKRVLAAHRRRGDVVVNRITEDVVIRALGGYILGRPADDHRQLRFRVRPPVLRAAFDSATVSYEGAPGLDEHRRMIGPADDTVGVGAVIEGDTADLRRAPHRRVPQHFIGIEALAGPGPGRLRVRNSLQPLTSGLTGFDQFQHRARSAVHDLV